MRRENTMEKNKLVCFIIPYFGTLPNYFPLFLRSCEINVDYDWLLLTDDHTPFDYPDNVKVIYMTFDQLKIRFEQRFPFPISLPSPKKLCDFKPTYGFIFEEELKPYPYWGYCDIDLVLGDMGAFLPIAELRKYQKHFYCGHMSIFENSEQMRLLFDKGHSRKEGDAAKLGYLDVFQSGGAFAFDEWMPNVETINEVAEAMNICINPETPMLDVRPFRSRFYSTVFDPSVHTWIHNSEDNFIVTWEKGKLYAYSEAPDGSLSKKEILYAHFQKRKMNFADVDLRADSFLFYPNGIKSCNQITEKMILHHMTKARIRRWCRVDENHKRFEDIRSLWIHRCRKLIKKLTK